MEFTNEQKQTIKKLQKLILSNVISCEDDVRPKIIARFKDRLAISHTWFIYEQ